MKLTTAVIGLLSSCAGDRRRDRGGHADGGGACTDRQPDIVRTAAGVGRGDRRSYSATTALTIVRMLRVPPIEQASWREGIYSIGPWPGALFAARRSLGRWR